MPVLWQGRLYPGVPGSEGGGMTSYSKGRAFEYRVRRHLEGQAFAVFRTAGSHSPGEGMHPLREAGEAGQDPPIASINSLHPNFVPRTHITREEKIL